MKTIKKQINLELIIVLLLCLIKDQIKALIINNFVLKALNSPSLSQSSPSALSSSSRHFLPR